MARDGRKSVLVGRAVLGAVLHLALSGCSVESGADSGPVAMTPAPSRPAGADAAWLAEVRARLDDGAHGFAADGPGYGGRVPELGLVGRFRADGAWLSVRADTPPIGVRTVAVRKGERGEGAWASPAPAPGACVPGAVDPKGACVPRLEYADGALTEWWVSRHEGFEQGWELLEAPVGEGSLVIEVAVDGAASSSAEGSVWLTSPEGWRLLVGPVTAVDALGAALPARLVPTPRGFEVHVDDAEASYPIEIDPLYTTATWTVTGTVGDAELPRMRPAGDVDGDGYDDVLIGGNGAVYLYAGTSTGIASTAATALASGTGYFGRAYDGGGDVNRDGYDDVFVADYDGATAQVYLYTGSASGLTESVAGTITNPDTGSVFGAAVAFAGDVNADGYDDLIVGNYWYNSRAGRAYVYHGSASGIRTTASRTITGGGSNYYLGYAVDGAGDVNGDGYDDVVIGAYGYACYSGGGSCVYDESGEVFVYHGSSSGIGASAGSSILAPSTMGRFGFSVAGAGDVDGDGYDDIVVGAPNYWYGRNYGTAYLYPGTASGVATSPTSTFTGTGTGNKLGYSVDGAGDVNGDGYDDVIVGEPYYTTSYGRAFLYTGSVAGLNPTASLTLVGASTSGDYHGVAVSGLGDVNGDGYGDYGVVASGYADQGGAWVHHGGATLSAGDYDFVEGVTDDHLGVSVASAGDVNGDGFDDVAVGAYGSDYNTGRVLVFHGSASALSTTATVTLTGPSSSSRFGLTLDAAGDTDGDGYDDLVVGAPGSNSAFVYTGASGGLSSARVTTLSGSSSFGAVVAGAGDVNGDGYADVVVASSSAFYVHQGSASGVGTAASTSSSWTSIVDLDGAGDVNGDGYADILLGSTSSAGTACPFYGSASGLTIPGTPPSLTGYNAGDEFGCAVAGVGDVNGDGYDDVVIGAEGYGGDKGRTYFYRGTATGLSALVSVINGGTAGDALGTSVDGVGDVDGDGYADVAIGAPGYGTTGAAYVHLGGSSGLGTSATYTFTGSGTLGSAVAAAGDVNGDGAPDLLVADVDYGDDGGAVSLYAGWQDDDGDGLLAGADCDDTDASVGAPDTGYADLDGDGFGDAASPVDVCAPTAGVVSDATDCDDGDASAYPGALEVCDAADQDEDCDGLADDADTAPGRLGTFYRDVDGDGHGDAADTVAACDAPAGYAAADDDCDDGDATISPSATEACDAADVDEDCDGVADDADPDAAGARLVYGDDDGDGYAGTAATFCDVPAGYVATASDCDDGDGAIHPGAVEVCDAAATDEDCSGAADDADPSVTGAATWYQDGDGDGYGGATTAAACVAPAGYVASATDCDDAAAGVHPGATEVCDAADVDEDCDGAADDGDAGASGLATWHVDADGDGYGGASTRAACDAPAGYVADGSDCDDGSAAVSPAAAEVCDAADVDEDCDGAADDADTAPTGTTAHYRDADGDGYGGAATTSRCDAGDGYVAAAGDCDDADASASPGATEELGDGRDGDCDGGETCWADADGDGDRGGETVASADLDCADVGEAGPAAPADCDDADPAAQVGGTEVVGDGVDGDCDGEERCYTDGDGDGWRVDDATVASADLDCADAGEAAAGAPDGDCDDADAAYHPGADEPDCTDPADYNCDGSAGTDDADADGVTACDDCDDTDARVHPGAAEPNCADPVDYNCDGSAGGADGDADGFRSCEDCDDGATAVNPAAEERCNAVDDDCDGEVDDNATDLVRWYADADGDGYTDPGGSVTACEAPEGYTAVGQDDCDDAAPDVHPNANDLAGDGVDQDCDGADAAADAPDPDPGACGCASGGGGDWLGAALFAAALVTRRRTAR